MNTTLFKRELRSSYKLWLIFIAILAMYISVIISMFDPKLGETLDLFAKAMPEMMSLQAAVSGPRHLRRSLR